MAKLRREDYGRKLVDEELERLEEKIANLYTKATYELDEKLSDYFRKFEERDAEMLAQLSAGEITESQYLSWRRGTIIGQESWFNMRERLAEDLTHSDEIAAAMINTTMPSVYASSYNFGAFMAEEMSAVANVDLSPFTIYNAEAVRILMAEDPDLLPSLNVDRNRDLQWNRKHIQSAIAQGIIQGDPMDKIAARLAQVTAMDKNAAIRNARTATTGVENAGRQAVADRCVKQGVPMIKEWNAVHDARTRDSHLLIDGEQREEDEKFSNGLLYSGDPSGNPAEVYNCRCATLHFIKGINHSQDMELYEKFMQEEHYDDWLRIKQAEQDPNSHWHMKNLEKEYAEEKQARLRGEIIDKWDNTLDEDSIQRHLNELLHPVQETVVDEIIEKTVEPKIPYLKDVSDLYKDGGRKQARHDEAIKEVMENFGMTQEEAEIALNQAVERLIEGADFGSRVDANILLQIIDDGRFKNQFETNTSKGALSFGMRTECEEYMFGVPEDALASDRPTYGMLFPNSSLIESNGDVKDFYRSGEGDWYGDCTVIYKKPNIIDSTTLTFGDSLGDQYRVGATLASDPVFTSTDWPADASKLININISEKTSESFASSVIQEWNGYIEIQMHGVESHSIENIEKVILKKGTLGVGELFRKLEELGIPYEWID